MPPPPRPASGASWPRPATPASSFTETEHAGVTIRSVEGAEAGAYALTDDQLVIGSDADAVATALDTHAAGTGTLAEVAEMTRLTERLPTDWLVFMTYDLTRSHGSGAGAGRQCVAGDRGRPRFASRAAVAARRDGRVGLRRPRAARRGHRSADGSVRDRECRPRPRGRGAGRHALLQRGEQPGSDRSRPSSSR